MSSNDWRDRAACNDYAALFRIDAHAGPAVDQAKAICARCPSSSECLELAMDSEGAAPPSGRYGIYGGHTRHERYRLHKQRAQAVTA
jgi:WhiB family redox-sensing transcriptional regulator